MDAAPAATTSAGCNASSSLPPDYPGSHHYTSARMRAEGPLAGDPLACSGSASGRHPPVFLGEIADDGVAGTCLSQQPRGCHKYHGGRPVHSPRNLTSRAPGGTREMKVGRRNLSSFGALIAAGAAAAAPALAQTSASTWDTIRAGKIVRVGVTPSEPWYSPKTLRAANGLAWVACWVSRSRATWAQTAQFVETTWANRPRRAAGRAVRPDVRARPDAGMRDRHRFSIRAGARLRPSASWRMRRTDPPRPGPATRHAGHDDSGAARDLDGPLADRAI